MELLSDGSVKFSTCKEILDYIQQFGRIVCTRDVSQLEDAARCHDLLSEPVVEIDEGDASISVTDGDLDEGRLGDIIDEAGEMVPGNDEDGAACGIVLEVNVAGIRFRKCGRWARWEAEDSAALGCLPLGCSESELKDLLCASKDADDMKGLISEALDDATFAEDQFVLSYRLLRSPEDDVECVERQLGELDFEGFYSVEEEYEWPKGTHRLGHKVYGWNPDMPDEEVQVEGLTQDDLISCETAARYLAEAAGWFPSKVVQQDKVPVAEEKCEGDSGEGGGNAVPEGVKALIALYDQFKMREFEEASADSDDPNILLMRVFSRHLRRCVWESVGGDEGRAQPGLIREVLRLAEGGDAVAQANMGLAYLQGVGVAADPVKSTEWLAKSAAQGYVRAMNGMGQAYMEGRGVERDLAKAWEWFEKGASAGCAVATYNAARTIFDDKEKFPLLLKAAEAGFPLACCSVGRAYLYGEGVESDQTKAYHWFRLAWEKGVEVYGRMNTLGMLGDRDRAETFREHPLVKMSVDELTRLGESDARALTYLGYLKEHGGRGVAEDMNAAIGLYIRAAEKGERAAQCLLAECYLKGRGVDCDERRALELFEKAAERGSGAALNRLAYIHYNGKGVKEDRNRAIDLYERAIAAGDLRAAENLAMIYVEQPNGAKEEYERGLELAWILVCRGQMTGPYLLGQCYAEGRGTEANAEIARAMKVLSVAAGFHAPLDDLLDGAMLDPGWLCLAYERSFDTEGLDVAIVELLKDSFDVGEAS